MKCRRSKTISIARFSALVGATVMLFAAQDPVAAEVYKTVDAKGEVVYSDHPLSQASQRISVKVSTPDPEELTRLAKQQAMLSAEAHEQAQQDRQQAAEQQKEQVDQRAQQQQRCDAARERYAEFSGGRVYKLDENGNQIFYSDQEIDQQRAASKAAMESACPH